MHIRVDRGNRYLPAMGRQIGYEIDGSPDRREGGAGAKRVDHPQCELKDTINGSEKNSKNVQK